MLYFHVQVSRIDSEPSKYCTNALDSTKLTFPAVWNEPNLYNAVYGGFWDGTQVLCLNFVLGVSFFRS